MSTICKKCGVELEDEMKRCPLCGTPAGENAGAEQPEDLNLGNVLTMQPGERHLLQRVLWQISAILLFSGILATLIIDVAINRSITWSVYPMSLCMIVFSYASVLALWHTKTSHQLMAGWTLSTLLLIIFHYFLPAAQWTIYLGIPILATVNIIALAFIAVFRTVKKRGLNLLAYLFVAIAVLCIVIEGIISHYVTDAITLRWSIIVAACLFPVVAALIFMFYRTRNNSTLQKIFHT